MTGCYLSLRVSKEVAEFIIAFTAMIAAKNDISIADAIIEALEGVVTSEMMDIYSNRADLRLLFQDQRYGYLKDPQQEVQFVQSVLELLKDTAFVRQALDDNSNLTPQEEDVFWAKLAQVKHE